MKNLIALIILCLSFACGGRQYNTAGTEEAPESPDIPAAVVQRQVEAYNTRDIDAFVATYSENVEIYDAEGRLTMQGHEGLRKVYDALFANTPDLHCRIENRITINNKVIDKESVTMRGVLVEAVAIYEVTGGKISKVAFVK